MLLTFWVCRFMQAALKPGQKLTGTGFNKVGHREVFQKLGVQDVTELDSG
jgi:hypothetical protein